LTKKKKRNFLEQLEAWLQLWFLKLNTPVNEISGHLCTVTKFWSDVKQQISGA
jgi:hypothetical protein